MIRDRQNTKVIAAENRKKFGRDSENENNAKFFINLSEGI